MLKNRTYDILKIITLHILPALSTLLFALCQIWGWEWGEPVCGTLAAVTTCLATVLGVSSYKYNKAELSGEDTDEAEG